MYTTELFSIAENKLYGYAHDSTLVAVVPSPAERVAVTESRNHDLYWVIVWCDPWQMQLNAGKTKTMIVSRSCIVQVSRSSTVNPIHSGWICAEGMDLVILGVTFDAKMTYEKHLPSVSSTAGKRIGIMRTSCIS